MSGGLRGDPHREHRERAKVRVKVPGSTANLGPGFDTLGLALNLYCWIDMSIATEKTTIQLFGDHVAGIPTDKSNLVYDVAQEVFAAAGVSHPELDIAMYSDIPLTRGLGSSAAAIVGGMVAANALIGNPLSSDELFQLASAREQHPDNVGASLFGGLVVAFWDGQHAEYVPLALDEQRLDILVIIPHFQLATDEARAALPKQVNMADAVFNVSHAAVLVAALATGNYELIRHAMKDKLHQPYRAPLIPGMERILREAGDHGALGIALSGAGPTLLALVASDSAQKSQLEHYLLQVFAEKDIAATTMWLQPSEGVKVVPDREAKRSLLDFAAVKGEMSR